MVRASWGLGCGQGSSGLIHPAAPLCAGMHARMVRLGGAGVNRVLKCPAGGKA